MWEISYLALMAILLSSRYISESEKETEEQKALKEIGNMLGGK